MTEKKLHFFFTSMKTSNFPLIQDWWWWWWWWSWWIIWYSFTNHQFGGYGLSSSKNRLICESLITK
jgi:hypothetical protein